MHAAVLTAVVNPYHPPRSSDVALDTLLVTIGLVIITLLVVIPAHMGRARENRRLLAEQAPVPTEAGTGAGATATTPR